MGLLITETMKAGRTGRRETEETAGEEADGAAEVVAEIIIERPYYAVSFVKEGKPPAYGRECNGLLTMNSVSHLDANLGTTVTSVTIHLFSSQAFGSVSAHYHWPTSSMGRHPRDGRDIVVLVIALIRP
jgi:hypothetical protein